MSENRLVSWCLFTTALAACTHCDVAVIFLTLQTGCIEIDISDRVLYTRCDITAGYRSMSEWHVAKTNSGPILSHQLWPTRLTGNPCSWVTASATLCPVQPGNIATIFHANSRQLLLSHRAYWKRLYWGWMPNTAWTQTNTWHFRHCLTSHTVTSVGDKRGIRVGKMTLRGENLCILHTRKRCSAIIDTQKKVSLYIDSIH